MGIGQGTPVADSSIELPSNNIDLPDLRLPRALKAWNGFRNLHFQQITSIGTLQPGEIALLAQSLSGTVNESINAGIVPIDHASAEKIALLKDTLKGGGNRAIFMRHGEQSPPEWISAIADPCIRKIRMMQNPFNREDLLTNKGLVNVFVTAFGLLYITQAIGKNFHVLSSENSRAKEVARIISTVVPGTTLSVLCGLTCITYKDERDNPPATIEELLEDIPSGFMPWNPELIDKWCKVPRGVIKQSEVIIKTVAGLIKKGTAEDGDNLFLILTHTQQLAEVLRLRGRLEDPSIRFPELTMLVLRGINDCLIFERGISHKKGVMGAET